ncbi:MAG: carboxymuconolactone decarboxylase family protein [Alphaproteobacteria bacterium]
MSSARPQRLPKLERTQVPAESHPMWDHVMRSRGYTDRMPTVFATIANSPNALHYVCAVGEYVRYKTDFDPIIRELVIMTVAQEITCKYEWVHHWRVAVKAGASEALLKKIGTPALEAEPMPIGPTVKYARLVANNQPVDDALFNTIKDHYGPTGFTDLTMMIGYYGALGRFINVTGVGLDDTDVDVPFNR